MQRRILSIIIFLNCVTILYNHFSSITKASVSGLIDYGYSMQYIIINLLDILLTIDINPNYPIKEIIIVKITELNTYLYENFVNA